MVENSVEKTVASTKLGEAEGPVRRQTMELDHYAMSDAEIWRSIEQWEIEGFMDSSWLQTPRPISNLSSSSTTPSEVRHRESYAFPATAPSSDSPAVFLSPVALEPEQCATTATDDCKSSPDPAKRKQQNRNAQRAHRDRQKKLIHDLWTEIHSLRSQNKELLELKVESHELKAANGRLRKEIEAMKRIWVEAVTHGDAG